MLKNIKRLIKGNFIAKIIGIAIMPIITRLYGPDEMGVAALFTSILLILSPLINLRYCLAIPLPRKNSSAEILLISCIFISFSITSLNLLILSVCKEGIVTFFGLSKVSDYIYIIVISSFLVSTYEVLSMWAARFKRFDLYSETIIKQSISSASFKIISGLIGWGALGLILGNIIQNVAGVLSFTVLYNKTRQVFIKYSIKRFCSVLIYYSNYVYLKLPAHIMYVISAQLPVLYSSRYYDMSDVGNISLASALIAIPVGAISQSISKVYYAEVSNIGKGNVKEIYSVTLSLIKKLVFLGLAISFSIYLASPYLFSIVFGLSWVEAGYFARAFSIVLISQIGATALITVLNVINMNFLSFLMHATRFVLVLSCFFVANVISLELLETIYAYSYVMVSHYFAVIFFILFVLKKKAHNERCI